MLTQNATDIVGVPATLKILRGLNKMEDRDSIYDILERKITLDILKLLRVRPMRVKDMYMILFKGKQWKVMEYRFTDNHPISKSGLSDRASSKMAYPIRQLKEMGLIEGGRSKMTVGSYHYHYNLTNKGRHVLKKIDILEKFLQTDQDFMTFYESKKQMDSIA